MRQALAQLAVGNEHLLDRPWEDLATDDAPEAETLDTKDEPDAETLDHLVETGESETIFQKAIMEQGRGQILDTVAEIQERHDAVRELERKLLELHQIFLDMSVLVEAQGEMLDNIETQVSKSVDYVHRGNVALVAARRYQRSSRKWMCCSIITALLIACAILLPVLQPWADGSA